MVSAAAAAGPALPGPRWGVRAGLLLAEVSGAPVPEDPADPAEPCRSANATGVDASAAPTPSATARAPTRPTYFEPDMADVIMGE